jgi:signal transduction histidine kinase
MDGSQRQRRAGTMKDPTLTRTRSFVTAEQAVRLERARIARELHDRVVQELILTVLVLRGAMMSSDSVADESPLLQVAAAASKALHNAREFLRELRTREPSADTSADRVLLADLMAPLIEQLRQTTSVIEVRIGAMENIALDGHVAREVKMIVREALVNAARHSHATGLVCTARRDVECIRIEIEDDGVGFDPDAGVLGFGLLGMTERAHALGANLEIRSSPGNGTMIALRLPR